MTMDDYTNQQADSPIPSPAKGRATTGRKHISAKGITKRNGRKMAPKRGGGRGKGRGRNKTYDDPRAQAAYERQRELKDHYSEIANGLKPYLEKLADANISQLIEEPDAYKQVPEFDVLQQQLDDRLAATIANADRALESWNGIAEQQFNLHTEVSEKKFKDAFNYENEQFLDGAQNRVSLLTELYRERVSATTVDYNWTYRQGTDEEARNQRTHVKFINGVEVPEPHLLDQQKKLGKGPQGRKGRTGPKRKAEDAPEGQPDAKKQAAGAAKGENGEEHAAPAPRHIGGLLSAENEQEAEPESNAPSPTPIEDGPTPDSDPTTQRRRDKDLPELPSAASEPDAWGVRTLNKRGPKANNRLIVPPQFEFDDDDIGFRDSTNDSTRRATRASRGRFLNTPNSRFWHLDQTIVSNNCLDNADGDLDAELVRKHRLHPKYGFFLPDSANDEEPPDEHVDGTRPVVLVTPNSSTLHASRSVRAMKMDEALREDECKATLSMMLGKFCEDGETSIDDITTDEMRDKHRSLAERAASELMEIDDDTDADEHIPEQEVGAQASVNDGTAEFGDNVSQLVEAAYLIEEDERSQQPASTKRSSRPYDAIRDVFGTSEPSASSASSAPFQPAPQSVNTYGLSMLADVAEHSAAGLHTHHSQPQAAPSNNFLQTALNPTPTPTSTGYSPIAPAPLQNQNLEARPQTPVSRNPFTNQAAAVKGNPALPPLRPSTRKEKEKEKERERAAAMVAATLAAAAEISAQQPPQVPPSGTQVPSPLLTALPGPGPTQAPPPPPSAVASPAPPPQEFGSPRGMMQSNTGSFYPPAPPRPYHQGYPIEHVPMMAGPVQEQGTPIPDPAMMHNQFAPPQPMQQPYPVVSPPMPGQAQLAPMPAPMGPVPPAPTPAPGPPPTVMAGSPPAPNHRQRNSGSSNGQNSSKYRKIAAAPIPHSRPWAPNGGAELRLSNYDPKGSIKDYMANEPPPRSGPTTIRGWSVNNVAKNRTRGVKKEGSEDRESPK